MPNVLITGIAGSGGHLCLRHLIPHSAGQRHQARFHAAAGKWRSALWGHGKGGETLRCGRRGDDRLEHRQPTDQIHLQGNGILLPARLVPLSGVLSGTGIHLLESRPHRGQYRGGGGLGSGLPRIVPVRGGFGQSSQRPAPFRLPSKLRNLATSSISSMPADNEPLLRL